MEKLHIALCDDEESALRILSSAVTTTFRQHGVQVETRGFLRADGLLKQLSENKAAFDIVMLDIRMPNTDGLQVARQIRAMLGEEQCLVLASNEEQRVFEAFSIKAFFFIRKSRIIEDVTEFVKHYLRSEQQSKSQRTVNFRQNGADLTLYTNEIVYVESEGRKQKVYLNKETPPIEINITMQEVEELLQEAGFIRVHKGFLVNNSYIARISGESIMLRNNVEVPISRRKLKEVREQHMHLTRLNQTMLR